MSSLLQELVSAQAAQWPERPAVVWRRTALSYGELEARSNQLARALRELGCRRSDRVCVSSLPTPDLVVAVLAIYKADAVCVPLDTTSPPARLARIVRAADPRCVITCAATAPLVDEIFRCNRPDPQVPVAALAASPIFGERYATSLCLNDLRGLPSRPVPSRNRASNPAQILFADGAGTPRGVVLTHAGLRRYVHWANEHFGVMPGDRHLLHPVASDVGTYSLIGTLAAGGTLYPVPADLLQSPPRLAEFARETEITLWFASAQLISAMAQLDLVLPQDFPGVRHVVWHGEAPRPSDLRHWMARLRHVSFTGLYGPTEGTVATAYYRVPPSASLEAPALPLGRARPGTGMLVLDDQNRPVTAGAIGEIHVVGAGLSPGYWRDPEATGARFVTNPLAGPSVEPMFRTGDLGYIGADGHVYPAGSREPVVTRGGHRFELGEVEAALASLGSVRAAAVVSLPSGETEGPLLCCAYVPISGLSVTSSDLREELATLVPAYMLPSRWQAFDALPCQADGSIARDELRRQWAQALTALG